MLVHGLNGHPRNTWTAKNGVFWPSQLLPVSLKSAQARVLTYGYNADVYTFGSGGKGGPSTDMIHQHAQTLLANLALERKSEERSDVPIIWVAHSLGGILVKRALELSHDLAGVSQMFYNCLMVPLEQIVLVPRTRRPFRQELIIPRQKRRRPALHLRFIIWHYLPWYPS